MLHSMLSSAAKLLPASSNSIRRLGAEQGHAVLVTGSKRMNKEPRLRPMGLARAAPDAAARAAPLPLLCVSDGALLVLLPGEKSKLML